MQIRNLPARRLRMGPQLGQRRQRRRVRGSPAPLEPEREGLELVHEDDVVELDEVTAFLAVHDRRRRGRSRRRRWRRKFCRLRVLFAGFVGLGGRFRRSLGVEEDRPVDVAGGLRLVPVVLHDVGEVDVLAHDL